MCGDDQYDVSKWMTGQVGDSVCPWVPLLPLAAPGSPWCPLVPPGGPWWFLALPASPWLPLAAPGGPLCPLAPPGAPWLPLASAPGAAGPQNLHSRWDSQVFSVIQAFG